MITVFTAIFWKFDVLKLQPKQDIPVKFVCFYDEKPDMEDWAEEQREIRIDNRFKHLSNPIRSKFFRTHPFDFFDGDTIWIDGSWRLLRDDSVSFFVGREDKSCVISTIKHPERSTIESEAKFCIDRVKYRWLPMLEQIEFYKNIWYKDESWLSAVWLIFMKKNAGVISMLNFRWWEILLRWQMDQLSFEFARWALPVQHEYIDINLRDNDYISFLNPHT